MTGRLAIVGAGGHARVVAETAAAAGYDVLGFVAPEYQKGDMVNGLPVMGEDAVWKNDSDLADVGWIVGIGDNRRRMELSKAIREAGRHLATIIHPDSTVSPTAQIGPGSVINAQVAINANAMLGGCCVVNTGAVVEHDVRLAEGVFVGPGAALAGGVVCEEGVEIGAGVVIIPNVHIGAHCMIGAGAVMVRDAKPRSKMVGVPARELP